MKRKCPSCQSSSEHHTKYGHFVRRSDGRKIPRYRCRNCLKHFSNATFQQCYRQKKRRINPRIYEYLCARVSQRRIAKILKINRITVARKFEFLARVYGEKNFEQFLKAAPITRLQFDDLETFEHTKCKPLSVIMAVDGDTRYIYGFEVSQMPATGHLAKISRKKYRLRADLRSRGRNKLFEKLSSKTIPNLEIRSDKSSHYPRDVKKHFPHALHITTKGRRGCVAGQGELKKVGYDPLFSLNHTFAMLRGNLNRLIRKSWCTTKKPENLAKHIEIYVHYHNNELLKSA